jgi:hypothetical protein
MRSNLPLPAPDVPAVMAAVIVGGSAPQSMESAAAVAFTHQET